MGSFVLFLKFCFRVSYLSVLHRGFRITSGIRHHIFKPVSVQAMWSAFQALHLANKKSRKNNYYVNGGSHKWVSYYQARIKSNGSCLHEWHAIVDLHEANCNSIYQIENKYVLLLFFCPNLFHTF